MQRNCMNPNNQMWKSIHLHPKVSILHSINHNNITDERIMIYPFNLKIRKRILTLIPYMNPTTNRKTTKSGVSGCGITRRFSSRGLFNFVPTDEQSSPNTNLVPLRDRVTREILVLNKYSFVDHILFYHYIGQERSSFNELRIISANYKWLWSEVFGEVTESFEVYDPGQDPVYPKSHTHLHSKDPSNYVYYAISNPP